MTGFRPLHLALLLIAAAAIGGPVWLLSSKPAPQPQAAATPGPYVEPPYVAPKPTSRANVARFERLATKACHCARGRDKSGVATCWAEFERATQPFSPSGATYACMGDETGLCFGIDGERDETCIMINRDGSGACSEREAQELAEKGQVGCGP